MKQSILIACVFLLTWHCIANASAATLQIKKRQSPAFPPVSVCPASGGFIANISCLLGSVQVSVGKVGAGHKNRLLYRVKEGNVTLAILTIKLRPNGKGGLGRISLSCASDGASQNAGFDLKKVNYAVHDITRGKKRLDLTLIGATGRGKIHGGSSATCR